jgi:hypothetical protein
MAIIANHRINLSPAPATVRHHAVILASAHAAQKAAFHKPFVNLQLAQTLPIPTSPPIKDYLLRKPTNALQESSVPMPEYSWGL